jgi:LacI family transcriptional regulator
LSTRRAVQKGKRRPTSQDVADLAGVSRATISAYLNRTRYVSPEVSRRIKEAIRQLNYAPDPLARALKLRDSQTIGLIIPVLSQFYTPMMRAINEIAHESGYGLLLCSSEENPVRERELLQVLIAKRITGILLAPCSDENKELLNDIQQGGTPIVQVNRVIEGLEADSVVSDNFKAVYTATQHLIQRGRRHIVLFGYDQRTLSAAQKQIGYQAALRDGHIEDSLCVVVKEHEAEQTRTAFAEFLASGRPFDGLVCTTQGTTAVALRLLMERGVKIPEHVAVVGYDDTVWSSLLRAPLTVISETTYQMGAEATRLLLKRMKSTRKTAPKCIVLESKFIIREST